MNDNKALRSVGVSEKWPRAVAECLWEGGEGGMEIVLRRGGGKSKRPKWQMLACLYKQPPPHTHTPHAPPFPNPHWWSGAFRCNGPPPPPPAPALHFTPSAFHTSPLCRSATSHLPCSFCAPDSSFSFQWQSLTLPWRKEGRIQEHTLSKESHLTEHMTGARFPNQCTCSTS